MPLAATKIVRELLYAPPSMPVLDLLAKMQATRIHLALIIDEYGGSDGLISIEDLVELIVGDIADEHDEAETAAVTPQSDGSFLAIGRASLDDVRAVIGDEFDVGDAAQEVDTLGGYLVMRAGHVPVRGELVPGPPPFETEVLDADPRRVKRVKIYRSKTNRPGKARELHSARASGGGAPAIAARRSHSHKHKRSAAAVKPAALIDAIILSWGWRRWLIAFAAGAVSALAMAPFYAWPLLFLTFPVLVWLIDGVRAGTIAGMFGAAIVGWWFGFGYFLAGLYWVGYAFLVDAQTFGWLLPFAVIGLPAGLALFTAFGAALARLLVDARRHAHFLVGRGAHRGRMVARPRADGVSLERIRLRPDRAAGLGAKRRLSRPLGADVRSRRRIRQPRRTRRPTQRHASALASVRAFSCGDRRAGGVRRRAAGKLADPDGRRRAAAHHATQHSGGRAL